MMDISIHINSDHYCTLCKVTAVATHIVALGEETLFSNGILKIENPDIFKVNVKPDGWANASLCGKCSEKR